MPNEVDFIELPRTERSEFPTDTKLVVALNLRSIQAEIRRPNLPSGRREMLPGYDQNAPVFFLVM
jgi:hypothetical protein